jgi:hypothetical protein
MKSADCHSKGNEKLQGSNEGIVNIAYAGHIFLGTANTVKVKSAFT